MHAMRGSNDMLWTDYTAAAHVPIICPYGDGIWI